MGYSIGFLRSYLALLGLIGIVAVVLGGANELFELGLFDAGYPVLGRADAEFGAFTLQSAVVVLVTTCVSLVLERWER